MKIAAMEYSQALDEVCRGKLDEHLGRGLKGVLGGNLFCLPYEVAERLRRLREAAVREYAKALEDDEKQQIAEAVKGWR